MGKNVMVGTDPEFVVHDAAGRLCSAITVLPNNGKTNKMMVGRRGGCMFYDNVQLEVNVRPADSAPQLVDNLSEVFRAIRDAIHPYTFSPIASAVFPDDQLQHPHAKEFGCDPEFCAYARKMIKAPTVTNGFRSAGGHIHLGQDDGQILNLPPGEDNDTTERDMARFAAIRMMDLFVGLPGVILDKDPSSKARRTLYGKAGSHRSKDYGVEYRSSGNFWLMRPTLVSLIFDLSQAAVRAVADGTYANLWPDVRNESKCKYPVDQVRQAINESDVPLARELVENRLRPLLPNRLFMKLVSETEDTNVTFRAAWGV